MSEVDGHAGPHGHAGMVIDPGQGGAIARALLWLVLGIGLAVGLFLAVTPEVAANEPGVVLELMGPVSVAALPGLLLLGFAVVRRRRLGLDDEEPTATRGGHAASSGATPGPRRGEPSGGDGAEEDPDEDPGRR